MTQINLLSWVGKKDSLQKGFSLLETLVMVATVGILGAIATPVWLTLLSTLQLNMAQDRTYSVIQSAKTQARRNGAIWQASFRQGNNQVEWSVHQAVPGQFVPPGILWNSLSQDVSLDGPEITLDCSSQTCSVTDSMWRVQFNHRGHANGQLGRITLKSRKGGTIKRCVFISTLIGNLRRAKEQPTPDETNRYCY